MVPSLEIPQKHTTKSTPVSTVVPAAEVLAAYRDLGNTVSGGERGTLACDPNFNRYTSYWLTGETLDATYAALEAMRIASAEATTAFLDEHRDRVVAFLRSKYCARTRTFATNSASRTQGIFASHTAIGVMKSIHGLGCDAPLSAKFYREVLCTLSIEGSPADPVADLSQLLRRASQDSPIAGALLDSPSSPLPSLTVSYMATSALWNLFPESRVEEFSRIVDVQMVRELVGHCLKFSEFGGKRVAGFTIHPDVPEPCVNTTCFALGLLNRLRLLDEVLDESTRDDVLRFLHLCFRDGGFTSTVWEAPSLNATFFGLRSLKWLMSADDFEAFRSANAPRIRAFVDSCVNPLNGGAAFSPDLERYVENCLATRYYVQIVSNYLDREGDDPTWRAQTFGYLVGQFNPENGGFRAYPRDRVEELPGDSHEGRVWLESFLDEKDDLLLDALERPSPLPEDLEDAYKSLSALYDEAGTRNPEDASLRTQIDSALGHLRRIQRREADQMVRSLEDGLALKLGEGQEIIDRIDALCDKYEDSSASDHAA